MALEPRPREGRPSARRLKDISHLYISTGRRSGVRADAAARSPQPRRALHLAVAGSASVAARVELVANLALQLARLGRSTTVVDLDPALPNVGFRLALDPPAYLGHLVPEPRVRCERGLLGIRLLVGAAGRSLPGAWPEAVREELRGVDCVLFSLGDPSGARDAFQGLAVAAPEAGAATTMARAAARSPMIGAWLASAHRPAEAHHAAAPALEAALWVVEAAEAASTPLRDTAGFGDLPVRAVVWGASAGAATDVWARVPWHRCARLPISALEPEHPAARAAEGIAQSLLAGFAASGGSHV